MGQKLEWSSKTHPSQKAHKSNQRLFEAVELLATVHCAAELPVLMSIRAERVTTERQAWPLPPFIAHLSRVSLSLVSFSPATCLATSAQVLFVCQLTDTEDEQFLCL